MRRTFSSVTKDWLDNSPFRSSLALLSPGCLLAAAVDLAWHFCEAVVVIDTLQVQTGEKKVKESEEGPTYCGSCWGAEEVSRLQRSPAV